MPPPLTRKATSLTRARAGNTLDQALKCARHGTTSLFEERTQGLPTHRHSEFVQSAWQLGISRFVARGVLRAPWQRRTVLVHARSRRLWPRNSTRNLTL